MNERSGGLIHSFMSVVDPPPVGKAPSRENHVRFPLRSLIGLALQSMQGCNVPTALMEREANNGVKSRYVSLTA